MADVVVMSPSDGARPSLQPSRADRDGRPDDDKPCAGPLRKSRDLVDSCRGGGTRSCGISDRILVSVRALPTTVLYYRFSAAAHFWSPLATNGAESEIAATWTTDRKSGGEEELGVGRRGRMENDVQCAKGLCHVSWKNPSKNPRPCTRDHHRWTIDEGSRWKKKSRRRPLAQYKTTCRYCIRILPRISIRYGVQYYIKVI